MPQNTLLIIGHFVITHKPLGISFVYVNCKLQRISLGTTTIRYYRAMQMQMHQKRLELASNHPHSHHPLDCLRQKEGQKYAGFLLDWKSQSHSFSRSSLWGVGAQSAHWV
jgi:hypothetical protein